MLAVVTPEEMAAIDRDAPESTEVLIARAGWATARAALGLLGGGYGRRVIVVAGKGNNGNDGREAARHLRARGVRVQVVEAQDAAGTRLGPVDLVVDAAYGTGFHGTYVAPDIGTVPVLAVDIPSGVDGLTGEAGDHAVRADATVTFAALKPGLLFQPGRALAGAVEVADIGLDCTTARAHLMVAADVARQWPVRAADAHKWRSAVWVVGGSAGMTGAPCLAARGAQRAGAGYVRLSVPGVAAPDHAPIEAVGMPLPSTGWAIAVREGLARCSAAVIGPGLGPDADTAAVREVVANSPVPVVVDGDGLGALGQGWTAGAAPVVLTPHDGEFARLTGAPPGPDRIASVRALALSTGTVVLLKGPTTVVAAPSGEVRLSISGDARLATAGTGDVLSGIIGALLAQGLEPIDAASIGAWVHGAAAATAPDHAVVAGDLPGLLAGLDPGAWSRHRPADINAVRVSGMVPR